jgi:hypothetical protein
MAGGKILCGQRESRIATGKRKKKRLSTVELTKYAKNGRKMHVFENRA